MNIALFNNNESLKVSASISKVNGAKSSITLSTEKGQLTFIGFNESINRLQKNFSNKMTRKQYLRILQGFSRKSRQTFYLSN